MFSTGPQSICMPELEHIALYKAVEMNEIIWIQFTIYVEGRRSFSADKDDTMNLLYFSACLAWLEISIGPSLIQLV